MKKIITGIVLITGFFVFIIYLFINGAFEAQTNINFSNLNNIGKILSIWGVLGAFCLWFWMLADYFSNRSIKNKIAWGFFLFIGHYVAAMLYFFAIYIPFQLSQKKENQK